MYYTFRLVLYLVVGVTFALFSSCSEEEIPVDEIILNVDKDVVLLEGDCIKLTAEVFDINGEILTNIDLRFFANDQQLDGPTFNPEAIGKFTLRAEAQGISSRGVDVNVISLSDITDLQLLYDGYNLLTTEAWSVTGTFLFEVMIEGESYILSTDEIDLIIDGIQSDQHSFIHFSTPGTREIWATFQEKTTSKIQIDVRQSSQLPVVDIPVIFHDYGLSLTTSDVRKVIDTLNGAFLQTSYRLQDVKDGFVNPNAINMAIRFVLAEEAPEGFVLSGPGIHRIQNTSDQNYLRSDSFIRLAENNTWDPNQYVNFWILDNFDGVDFDIPGYRQEGRGYASFPRLTGTFLEGLRSLPMPEEDKIAGIICNAGSIFGEHIDYAVTMMGTYYGLFTTLEFGCDDDGDFCADTKGINFNLVAPNRMFYDCTERLFRPTNFMSITRQYRDFTLDQAERMRTVMQFANSRVGL